MTLTLTAVVLCQGIYVLQDNKFLLLCHLSAGKQYLEHAPKVCERYSLFGFSSMCASILFPLEHVKLCVVSVNS